MPSGPDADASNKVSSNIKLSLPDFDGENWDEFKLAFRSTIGMNGWEDHLKDGLAIQQLYNTDPNPTCQRATATRTPFRNKDDKQNANKTGLGNICGRGSNSRALVALMQGPHLQQTRPFEIFWEGGFSNHKSRNETETPFSVL